MKVLVGMSTCNLAAGSQEVYQLCQKTLNESKKPWILDITGCYGMCYAEPQVRVIDDHGVHFIYSHITPIKMETILQQHLEAGEPVAKWLVDKKQSKEAKLLNRQHRIVLRNCGIINPENIDDYLQQEGYRALRQVLKEMSPNQVIEIITRSGLRGRGGGGFSTGLKWSLAYQE